MVFDRYSPKVGKKHLHREGSERFQYTPAEILAHATSWEDRETRWNSASILKTAKGKFVYTSEDISLWQGEGCSHICIIYNSWQELLADLYSQPFADDLQDELAREGLISEAELFPEV